MNRMDPIFEDKGHQQTYRLWKSGKRRFSEAERQSRKILSYGYEKKMKSFKVILVKQ